MRHAVAAMAGQGNNLIVDEVMTEKEAGEYRLLLQGFEMSMVGVFASLDVLEERERKRGDRMAGLARGQHSRIHKGIVYDLEIDTSNATPEDCAREIKTALKL
jgi:chloramphenicol 3-O phosphotransferase